MNNNGHPYVDLGLPSGTLWATCNVGASKQSDYGLFFQWGDIKGYTKGQVGKDKQFTWDDYKFSINGSVKNFSKYTNSCDKLELKDDAAHANMGGDWHIPTSTQIRELIDNTITTWITLNDNISGMVFTAKKDAKKSIFFPATGYAWDGSVIGNSDYINIWASIIDPDYINNSQYLESRLEDTILNSSCRCNGFSVRGVIDKKCDNSKDKKNNMNENLDLIDILKDAPEGTKLWSPICGECELCKEDLTCKTFPIVCIGIDDGLEWHFKADGSFTENTGVECLLFPSKENRDWATFKVPKKHKEFKPFQKVLVRSYVTSGEYIWSCALYSHYDESMGRHYIANFACITNDDYIMPYEGNEDKLGKKVE